MSDVMLNYFMYNNKVYNSNEFSSIYNEDKKSLYEVIRIVDSVPLFLEDHYNRLINSGKIVNYTLNISYEEIKNSIMELIKLNNTKNYNLKIVINSLDSNTPNVYFFFIKTSYPDSNLYNIGVDTFIFNAERENPNAKIINSNLRNRVNTLLNEKNCFEALLVNNLGFITEGSRSNLFFIKNNKLYTTPGGEVLLGITRKKIVEVCEKNNIEVIESPIKEDELSSFDALFISGTSPKALPIKKVDNLIFDTENPLLRRVINLYNDEISSYVSSHK